jgi:hypothetical protein
MKIKIEELRALSKQINNLNEEEVKKINDEYVNELKELSKIVTKKF